MSKDKISQFRILKHFSKCPDPRQHRIKHKLIDIIVIVVLATICGEQGWEDFYDWALDKQDFLKEFLSLENGIPSPDTLRRVTERLNPDTFFEAFLDWSKEISSRLPGQINIDGKTLKKAMNEQGALHLVSAFCSENGMVLGSIDTGGKGKEIPAIKELLKTLVLQKGDVITTDAIGCQKEIMEITRKGNADYVIALKANQGNLWSEVNNFFSQALKADEYAPCENTVVKKQSHGRSEEHTIWISKELDWLADRKLWKDLKSIICIERKYVEGDKEKREIRYYISSLDESPEKLGKYVNRHWAIENEYHWHLDVTFKEDDSVISSKGNKNLRVARNIALQLLKADKTHNISIRRKMNRCRRSEEFLKKVLLIGNF